MEQAKRSCSFFDLSVIPAIRSPLPLGVSAVRFVSNLDGMLAVELSSLGLQPDEADLLAAY
jgi:hypothetical protein